MVTAVKGMNSRKLQRIQAKRGVVQLKRPPAASEVVSSAPAVAREVEPLRSLGEPATLHVQAPSAHDVSAMRVDAPTLVSPPTPSPAASTPVASTPDASPPMDRPPHIRPGADDASGLEQQSDSASSGPVRDGSGGTGLSVAGGTLHPHDVANLRRSLEAALGGFRKNVVAIAGLFGNEQAAGIASALAAETQSMLGQTTVMMRAESLLRTRGMPAAQRHSDWKVQLRRGEFNIWPGADAEVDLLEENIMAEWLAWLRGSAELTVLSFDNLTRVYDLRALSSRIDGIVIVNSGQVHDLERMSSAARVLRGQGVRILGQVRNFAVRS